MFIGWRSHRKWDIAEGRFLQDSQKIKFCEFLYFLHALFLVGDEKYSEVRGLNKNI